MRGAAQNSEGVTQNSGCNAPLLFSVFCCQPCGCVHHACAVCCIIDYLDFIVYHQMWDTQTQSCLGRVDLNSMVPVTKVDFT